MKGHTRPLVLGHLEQTASNAFSDYPRQITELVHGKHGVYALYKGDRLYYVGLATNLRNRIKQHLKDRHAGKWNRFSLYLVRKVEHIAEIETIVLRIANPKGNKSRGRLPGSKDLWKDLERNIRSADDFKIRALHHEVEKAHRIKATRKTVNPHTDGPPLAKYKGMPTLLRVQYKGRIITARVRRDGAILYAGKVYNSPSMAGKAAIKRSTCNGWTFWKYEQTPGNWIPLDTLRR